MPEGPVCTITRRQGPEGPVTALCGSLCLKTAEGALKELQRQMEDCGGRFALDLSGIGYIDSQGMAVLVEICGRCGAQGIAFKVLEPSECCRRMASIVNKDKFLSPLPPAHAPEGFLAQVGGATIDLWDDIKDIVSFIGECTIMLFQALCHPGRVRWRNVGTNLEQTGVDALPIMCMVQFLIGIILTVLGKTVLGMYGAQAFIPDLVGIAVTQELGPIITAVVLAGRSGASYAAEIGTMQVSEEVDALKSMGFDPGHFLVLPKILAAAIAMPCLLIIGNVVAVIGSIVMCCLTTDITLPAYIHEIYKAITINMVGEGLFKSVVFAIMIASLSCMRGMQVRGGAESVGRSTTAAVVSGIFITILMDAVFTTLFHPPA